MIGEKVSKRSGKPFKSGYKVNTVKSIVEHPYLEDSLACTFEEDDSIVWIEILVPISRRKKLKIPLDKPGRAC